MARCLASAMAPFRPAAGHGRASGEEDVCVSNRFFSGMNMRAMAQALHPRFWNCAFVM